MLRNRIPSLESLVFNSNDERLILIYDQLEQYQDIADDLEYHRIQYTEATHAGMEELRRMEAVVVDQCVREMQNMGRDIHEQVGALITENGELMRVHVALLDKLTKIAMVLKDC